MSAREKAPRLVGRVALALIYGELSLWLLSFLEYVVASVGVVLWRDWPKAALVAAGL